MYILMLWVSIALLNQVKAFFPLKGTLKME